MFKNDGLIHVFKLKYKLTETFFFLRYNLCTQNFIFILEFFCFRRIKVIGQVGNTFSQFCEMEFIQTTSSTNLYSA
jgi:hypothetical protein